MQRKTNTKDICTDFSGKRLFDLICRNKHISLTRIKARWDHTYAVRCTCRASVPGCCSNFTVLPPAVFCPRPSCQVRFPPVRRLRRCLKSSGRALYSTAGLQKLKLDAAGEIKAQGIMIRQPDLPVTTKNVQTAWDTLCKKPPHSAWLVNKRQSWTHLDTLSFRDDLISSQNTCSHMLCWFWAAIRQSWKLSAPGQAPL